MIRFLLNSLTTERSPEQVQGDTQVENWDPCPCEEQACLSQDSRQRKDTGVHKK